MARFSENKPEPPLHNLRIERTAATRKAVTVHHGGVLIAATVHPHVRVTNSISLLMIADNLSSWVQSRLGMIVGADGRGGSGACIELEDGSEALVTARHVIIDTILTGSMSIARFSDRQTITPERIRISSRSDAAYIVSKSSNPESPRIKFKDWTETNAELKAGMLVLPVGFPGAWKEVDEEKKAIPSMKALALATTLSDPPARGDYIICDLDERVPGLPSTLAGMSGGPLFSADRKFLGVLVHEVRRIGNGEHGEIHAAPVSELRELFEPAKSSISDYIRQKASAPALPLVNQRDQSRRATMEIQAEMYWSEKTPNAPMGRFGRIQMLRFLTPPGAENFPINTESLFFPNDDSEAARKRALHEEVKFLLNRTGWAIEPEFLGALESEVEP